MNGEARAKHPITSQSCAGSLRKWDLTTKTSCCTWPKKSQDANPEIRFLPIKILQILHQTAKTSRRTLRSCRGLLWWQIRGVVGARSVRCVSQRSKSEIPAYYEGSMMRR